MDWNPQQGRVRIWIGRLISILISAPFMMSAGMKLSGKPEVAEGLQHLGIPERLLVPLAILELSCTVLYLIPWTSVLGAVLMTGYMGGAIMAHLRVGDSFFMQIAFGLVVWLGIYLREEKLHKVLPLRCCPCKKAS